MPHQTGPRPATYRCPHVYAPSIPPKAPHYTFPCHSCCLHQNYHTTIQEIRQHYAPAIEKTTKKIINTVEYLIYFPNDRQLHRDLQYYEDRLRQLEEEQQGRERALRDCIDNLRRIEGFYDPEIRDKRERMGRAEGMLTDKDVGGMVLERLREYAARVRELERDRAREIGKAEERLFFVW